MRAFGVVTVVDTYRVEAEIESVDAGKAGLAIESAFSRGRGVFLGRHTAAALAAIEGDPPQEIAETAAKKRHSR